MAIQVQERIPDMVRISLSLSAAALAILVSGCTLCDTCDDFPVPCADGNCGVAMTSAPISPFLGSYTPLRPTASVQPAPFEPAAPATAPVPPGMSAAPPLPDEDPNPSSPDAPGVPAPDITTPPAPAATPGAETLPSSAEPTTPPPAPASDAPKTSQIMLESEAPVAQR